MRTGNALSIQVLGDLFGSRPDRPDYLGGDEQARRHRAACNRGHGLLRWRVEFRDVLVLGSDEPKHYRAMLIVRATQAAPRADYIFETASRRRLHGVRNLVTTVHAAITAR